MSHYGFSDDAHLDVTDDYSSIGWSHLIFVPGYQPITPRFDYKKHLSAMIFQICPKIADGQVVPPFVKEHGEVRPTNWFQRVPILSCGSSEQIQLVMFDPGQEKRGELAVKNHPYHILRQRVSRAVYVSKTHEHWAGYLSSETGSIVALPRFSDKYYMQAVVYSDGKSLTIENGLPLGLRSHDKHLALIRVSKTGIEAIRAAALEGAYRLDANGNPEETIGLKCPQYFGIVNRKRFANVLSMVSFDEHKKAATQFSNESLSSQAQDGLSVLNTVGIGGETVADEEEFEGYNAAMAKTTFLMEKGEFKAPLGPIDYSKHQWDVECKRKFMPWSQIFRVLPFEEQAVHIAKSLSDLPDILTYCWGDTEYWTEEIQGIVRKRMTMRMPMGLSDQVPQQSMPQQSVLQQATPQHIAAQNAAMLAAQNAAALQQQLNAGITQVYSQNPHAVSPSKPTATVAHAPDIQFAAIGQPIAKPTEQRPPSADEVIGDISAMFGG